MLSLTKQQIDVALPKIAIGLDKYLWIQNRLHKCDVSTNQEFQKKFNGFYKIRRDKKWQKIFYNLLEVKKEHKPAFNLILLIIFTKTKRLESSFASKLVATINPQLPIIDSIVLKNLGLKPVTAKTSDKWAKIDILYKTISKTYKKFISSRDGKNLITQFQRKYPNKKISEVKMLDFVLWQTRN